MTENEALVAAIEAERAAQGMKQEDLAALTGASATSIQRYLSGARVINTEMMWKIAKALDVPVSALWLDAERRLQRPDRRSAPRFTNLEDMPERVRSRFDEAANAFGLANDNVSTQRRKDAASE